MRISFKILIPTGIMLILAVSAVSFIGYSNISDEIDNVMGVTTQATLEDINVQIENGVSESETLKRSLNKNFLRIARSLAIMIENNPEALDTDFLIETAERMGVDEIHVIDNQGVLFAGSVPGFFGFDFSTSDQTKPFLRMLTDKSFELAQDPSYRAVDGVLFQYIGVPIKSEYGLVQIGVQPTELQQLLETTSPQFILSNFLFQSGGFAYIISPETGLCTVHTNREMVGMDMSEMDYGKTILTERNGSLIYHDGDTEYYTSFMETEEGIMAAVIPTAAYRSSLRPILITLILTSLAALIILMVIMLFLVNRIVSPLGKVSAYLELIAAGDLSLSIESKLTRKKDETGKLSRSLQNMTNNLQSIVQEVTSAANKIASESQQVSDSSQQLSSGTTEQAASAEEVYSSMEEMSANIGQNADNSRQTEKIAIQAAQDAQESSTTVQAAVDAMMLIATKISIIEEISRSTNLLALNAAIEAARAGEHGRGFAVVASEVRKLAEQSQMAAGEITDLAARTMELSQGSGEKLEKLVPGIQKTAELVEEISSASNEQQIGVDQITSAIQQLDKVIQTNAASSEELAATSEELAAQAEQLKSTIQYFKLGDVQNSPAGGSSVPQIAKSRVTDEDFELM